MSENNFTKHEDIKKLLNITMRNKKIACIGVCIALALSFTIICCLIQDKHNDGKLLKPTITTSEIQHFSTSTSDSLNCKLPTKIENITEKSYNNTPIILLYVSVSLFVFLALYGSFSILVKVLKSENELNTKIFDLEKELYKENKIWELTCAKKEYDSLKDEEKKIEKSIKKKHEELDYAKEVFEYKKANPEFDLKKYLGKDSENTQEKHE